MTKNLPSIFADSLNSLEKMIGDMNGSFIDFDRVFERFDRAFPVNVRTVSFPPADLLKVEGGYIVQLAVAGYSKDDIVVEVSNDNVLTVTGKQENKTDDGVQYLFKGISARSFIRKWQLLDTDSVSSVNLKDGMLSIKIDRAPAPEPQVKRLAITAE
jgi:molecular chaperone IbpA